MAAIWLPRGTSPLSDPEGWLGDCEGGQTPEGAPSGLLLGDSMCARGRAEGPGVPGKLLAFSEPQFPHL